MDQERAKKKTNDLMLSTTFYSSLQTLSPDPASTVSFSLILSNLSILLTVGA